MSYILASLPGISIESNFLDFSSIGTQTAGKEGAMEHHLLNAHEAAEVLKMDRRTLIRWARLGQVPAHPMGEGKRKLWRFLEHELLDWVEARKAEKKGPLASRIELAISAHARRSA
jgi:predicted DNA-binding transcriptional regulator AlpA